MATLFPPLTPINVTPEYNIQSTQMKAKLFEASKINSAYTEENN